MLPRCLLSMSYDLVLYTQLFLLHRSFLKMLHCRCIQDGLLLQTREVERKLSETKPSAYYCWFHESSRMLHSPFTIAAKLAFHNPAE